MDARELLGKIAQLEEKIATALLEHDPCIENLARALEEARRVKHCALSELEQVRRGCEEAWDNLPLEDIVAGVDERVRPDLMTVGGSDRRLFLIVNRSGQAVFVGDNPNLPMGGSCWVRLQVGGRLSREVSVVCPCCCGSWEQTDRFYCSLQETIDKDKGRGKIRHLFYKFPPKKFRKCVPSAVEVTDLYTVSIAKVGLRSPFVCEEKC